MKRNEIEALLAGCEHKLLRLKENAQPRPGELCDLIEDLERNRVLLLDLLEDRDSTSREAERSRLEWMAAFDAIGDPIFMHDREFRVLRANKAYALRAGKSFHEIIGRPYWEVFPMRDGPLPGCRNAMHESTGQEEELTLDDGTMLISRTFPILDADDTFLSSIHTLIDVTAHRRAEQEMQSLHLRINKAMEQTVRAVALTVEKRDPYTAGHQQRVADLAVAIARAMGWDKVRLQGLYLGGLIHDIGKIYLPAEILNRPGRLTAIEFNLIKEHARIGHEIIKDVDFPWPVAQMILQHHERLDGSGYPGGLDDGQIIPEARILAVADVVEAMASHRPYRPGLGIDRALDEIAQGSGASHDPEVVSVCTRLFREQGYTLPVTESG